HELCRQQPEPERRPALGDQAGLDALRRLYPRGIQQRRLPPRRDAEPPDPSGIAARTLRRRPAGQAVLDVPLIRRPSFDIDLPGVAVCASQPGRFAQIPGSGRLFPMDPAGAYTADRAAALSGVPKSTLHWWARHDVLVPSVSATKVMLWSYADLMGL